MILLTVGTQLPFDRLVRVMDEFAPHLPDPVIAQIGRGSYEPVNMEWHRVIEPTEFERLVTQSRFVVSHAGIGSILTAERHGKGIILFPRTAYLGEHRNEHQMATVTMVSGRPGLAVANDTAELRHLLDNPPPPSTSHAYTGKRDRICEEIAAFLAKHAKRN